MDKPKGNTITIKLNREEQPPILDETKENDVDASPNLFPNEMKIDTELEDSDVFLEAAAAQESVDESFDWIIPESAGNEIEEYKIVSSQKVKTSGKTKQSSIISHTKLKNGKGFKSIVVSAVFAILLGTGFGFLMLKLVITEQGNKAITEPVIADHQGTEKGTTNSNTAAAVVKPLTTFVIQGGIYSTLEAANNVASQVSEKGAPAQSIKMGGKEYLFLGVANTIEDAKKLGSNYKDQGVADVWAKPIPIAEKTFSNVNDSERSFLETSLNAYQQLSKVTASALLTNSITDDSIQKISSLDKQINSSDSKQIKNAKVKDLKTYLTNAVVKVEAFQKTKEETNLIDAQQNLLNFLSLYYSM